MDCTSLGLLLPTSHPKIYKNFGNNIYLHHRHLNHLPPAGLHFFVSRGGVTLPPFFSFSLSVFFGLLPSSHPPFPFLFLLLKMGGKRGKWGKKGRKREESGKHSKALHCFPFQNFGFFYGQKQEAKQCNAYPRFRLHTSKSWNAMQCIPSAYPHIHTYTHTHTHT